MRSTPAARDYLRKARWYPFLAVPAFLDGSRRGPSPAPSFGRKGSEMSPAFAVSDLRKVYRVHEREGGILAAFRSLAHRRATEVAAVDGISFAVEPGEI